MPVTVAIRVRYAETDQMNVVYYANYLVWFEIGRVELLRSLGLAYSQMEIEHKLVLPEGTRLTGEVVLAKRARHFHRAGQLRFNFQKVDLPQEAANLRPAQPRLAPMKTQATLAAAEGSGKAPIQVDSEGGVQAKESNTRFIAPAISVLIASQASYEGRHPDSDEPGVYVGGGAHVSGRTLGGGLGLGMLGAAIAELSVRRDGLRLLRISVVWVFERHRARSRSRV